jgi:hypothetical protein
MVVAQILWLLTTPCVTHGMVSENADNVYITDPVIALRLKDLFTHVPDYNFQDLQLLKFGRHFRIHPRLQIILGRNQEETDICAAVIYHCGQIPHSKMESIHNFLWKPVYALQ